MKRNRSAIVWGVLLVALGALVTLHELNVIELSGRYVLPIIFFGVSLCLHVGFFAGGGKSTGLLIPAGILLTYGVYFLLVALRAAWGWWPLFILGPAVGLFEEYVFNKNRSSGSIVVVFILTAISGFFLLSQHTYISFWMFLGAALVILGTVILISGTFTKKQKNEETPPQPAYTPPTPPKGAPVENVPYEVHDDPAPQQPQAEE